MDQEKYKYVYNQERDFYDYHVACMAGVTVPDPAPKDGFVCEKYENKLSTMPRIKRGECVIEVKND